MKTPIYLIAVAMMSIFSLTSCDKEEETLELSCDLELTLEPVCQFNPKQNADVQFPVYVHSNRIPLSTEDYIFSWSKDADFGGSAIGASYAELPITVTVTEIATGCTSDATLQTAFWD